VLHNALPPGRYPIGTGSERTAARAALGLPAGVPIVLFYGRLTAAKGAQTLIEAWRRLRPAVDGAVLVLLGDTPAAEEREMSAALARLPAGTWRRFSSRPDVVAFLHASDVVVVPSTVPESFGRAVLEGMATGRPVLASRIGAIPEILSGTMSRFLVSPGSPAELAERLSPLLHWRRLEPGLGQACADWAAARFPHAEHVEGLEGALLAVRRGAANHG
jgi:glycosyltransferase involved in cell wall biosynthesis